MTADITAPGISTHAPDSGSKPRPAWLDKFDAIVERAGDWFNPILVKESRQALKSKHFVLTFSLLLFAAWGWTAIAILTMMPRIYYQPSGDTMLWGYYLVLAVPMLLVVPLAAHRSLASEVDDGTLDLLSVTNLSPLQIITGKLASAALQMMLYFVALFPCVAFSYLLRGVDIPTIICLIGLTLGMASILTVAGLFFASLATGRSGQLGMMVLMLVIVGIAQLSIAGFAYQLIEYGFTGTLQDFLAIATSFILFIGTLCYILLRAAAAQLSPPSENRSTPVRYAMIAHQLAVFAIFSFALLKYGNDDEPIFFVVFYMASFWCLMGTLMVGETDVLTPRVRRDLPATFFARSILTWLTPGPGTGLILAVSSFLSFCIALYITMSVVQVDANNRTNPMLYDDFQMLVMTTAGYLMLLLSLTRLCMWLVRLRSNPPPAVALAVLAIVAGMIGLAPYSIEMHLNDYARTDWSVFQITNWAWTLGLLLDRNLDPRAPYLIFIIGGIVWALLLVTLGRVVLPLRIATPDRVLAERNLGRKNVEADEMPIDPLAN
jgi:ABC-type transport system involved in cytochrome c biogenesis permease component